MTILKAPRLLPLLGAVILGFSTPTFALDTQLQAKLSSMQVADQAIRNDVSALTKALREEPDADKRSRLDAEFKVLAEKMRAIDAANQQAAAEILASGWPTKETIGQAGMSDRKSNVAMLGDRLLVRQGRPQLYGTQIKGSGALTLYPVDSEADLDKRRSEMGLEPICAYLANFATMFGPVDYAPCKGK